MRMHSYQFSHIWNFQEVIAPRYRIFYFIACFIQLLVIIPFVNGQWNPQWNEFERNLCRERWYRLDWKSIIQPCKDRMAFANNTLPQYLKTSASRSYITVLNIKRAGEYSQIAFQSVDTLGSLKQFGGDTWRVFIRGPSSITPYVYDLNNGQYETSFLIMEAGHYSVELYLEGSLCSAYVDPPADWFIKGDYNGHFQEEWMYKYRYGWSEMLKERMWDTLGSSPNLLQFDVQPFHLLQLQENMLKLKDWRNICRMPTKCKFLWDGFGRWVAGMWKPYDVFESTYNKPSCDIIKNSHRRKKGFLWIYGDCFAHHFYEMVHNQTLCENIFKKCEQTYNWVYPRLNENPEKDPSIHKKDPRDISISRVLKYLRNVLTKKEMKKDSGLLLNYGLHFVRSSSFDNYKKLIDGVKNELSKYKGHAVWRTTTAIWKRHWKVHKRFQTYQRVLLFNAYAASVMCNAGFPVIDVLPVTASSPSQPKDGIHYEIEMFKPVENILINYFRNLL